MSFLRSLHLAVLIAASLVFGGTSRPVQARHVPISVIVDTDVDVDTDDSLALALLHALQSRGEVDILAITISTDDPWAAPYVSIINTFYGHPGIQIGAIAKGSMPRRASELHKYMRYAMHYDYLRSLIERRKEGGVFVYPRQLTDRSQATEAVTLLRKTLSSQRNESVIVIEIGQSTNLARLLDSPGDSMSPLDGRSLLRQKVRLLSIMAGSFFGFKYNGKAYPKGTPEWNLMMDPKSAQIVFNRWPTPIVAEDCRLSSIPPKPQSAADVERSFQYAPDHPILENLRLYTATQFSTPESPGDYSVRWPREVGYCDEYAAFYAVRGDSKFFSISKPGKVTVLDDGGSRFEYSSSGRHRFLMLNGEQRIRTPEAIALLRSEPPAVRAQY